MGWESRGGRRYYYRKARRGGRVVSEYVGSGRVAELVSQLEGLDRQERERARDVERARRDEIDAVDRRVDELAGLARDLAFEALEAAGYHRHGGEWRRRRG